MTDGVTLNPGTGGAVVDTETNAGRSNAQMQRVKIVTGAIDVDGGDVDSTHPFYVGVADGADITLGAKADAAWSGTGAGSLVAVLKAIWAAVTGATPAGTNTIGTVLGPLPTTIVSGQQTLTATAAALPSNALQNGISVNSIPSNTGTVYVGPSGVTTSTGYPLTPGQSISFAVANSADIYIVGTSLTDKAAFAGN